jgi:DeoR/GlpR family transcriptional regulator of sugar metabolism
LLQESDTVTVRELAQRFGVSQMTAHRDLDALEARGVLRKIHGGATAQPSTLYESSRAYRLGEHRAEKERIARRAVQEVKPGSSLALDDSTTTLAMVPLLATIPHLTVVTNSIPVLAAFAPREDGSRVILLGGTYSPKYESTHDLLAEHALSELRVDVAFLSASAADTSSGIYQQDAGVARVKRGMLACAAEAILLVDASKFGKRALQRVAAYDAFRLVITDAGASRETLAALRRAGTEVELAR